MITRARLAGAAAAAVLASLSAVATPAGAQEAVPTDLRIRVIARDAKIIGSGVGGARVEVRDADTGELLARGVQEGGTGDTRKIMTEPHPRDGTVFDTPGAAAYTATLALREPTVVEIAAEGPLEPDHAGMRASKTMLVIPGMDVGGEGIVLEIHGFRVEILEPSGAARAAPGRSLPVRARITMMCGCPTEPGGLWDASDYTLEARLVDDGRIVASAPMRFSGVTSVFRGEVPVPGAGELVLQVVAADPEEANFGMASRPVTVTP